jgi:hypothetical protein
MAGIRDRADSGADRGAHDDHLPFPLDHRRVLIDAPTADHVAGYLDGVGVTGHFQSCGERVARYFDKPELAHPRPSWTIRATASTVASSREGLDNDLIRIRLDQDSGRITELEACWLRCTALEQHIAGLAALRAALLGD